MDTTEEKAEEPTVSVEETVERKLSVATLETAPATEEVKADVEVASGEESHAAVKEEVTIETPAPAIKEETVETAPEITSVSPGEFPKDVTFACLMFTTEGNGELFLKWGEAPLPGSLAIFMTKKKIPPFKFKKSTELTNNIGGNRKKFVTGLAAFFKECDAYDGIFQILDCSEHGFGDVWVSIGGKKWGKEAGVPKKVKLGESVDINTIEALVILPRACAVFDGCLKIDIMRFLNTGTREGAAWHRT